MKLRQIIFFLLVSIFVSSSVLATEQFDIVIKNGRVMDPESNLDAVRNVGINSGKITLITNEHITGNETIDAKGLVVAPGFTYRRLLSFALTHLTGFAHAPPIKCVRADNDSQYEKKIKRHFLLMPVILAAQQPPLGCSKIRGW